jgi:hypothetical protein
MTATQMFFATVMPIGLLALWLRGYQRRREPWIMFIAGMLACWSLYGLIGAAFAIVYGTVTLYGSNDRHDWTWAAAGVLMALLTILARKIIEKNRKS